MDNIIMYCIIAAIAVIALAFVIIWIIRFAKMTPEKKKETLKTYLKGLIALAEQEIVGTKKGEERLKMVEDYFNKKAPTVYKIILLLIGKDNLKEIIEEALKEIKQSFGNWICPKSNNKSMNINKITKPA